MENTFLLSRAESLKNLKNRFKGVPRTAEVLNALISSATREVCIRGNFFGLPSDKKLIKALALAAGKGIRIRFLLYDSDPVRMQVYKYGFDIEKSMQCRFMEKSRDMPAEGLDPDARYIVIDRQTVLTGDVSFSAAENGFCILSNDRHMAYVLYKAFENEYYRKSKERVPARLSFPFKGYCTYGTYFLKDTGPAVSGLLTLLSGTI